MKIRIKDVPVVCGSSSNAYNYRKAIMAIAGQTVEVDTQYLFRNQFNTVIGLRVMEDNVAEIIDDERAFVLEQKVREL